ncbi:hypothetical protein AB0C14_35715 [Microbispora hainanensis]|uniref:hypothetical protein n=1 Tax=Microbispora hainanensis TaxID=568844 RepID=UPI0033CE9D7B
MFRHIDQLTSSRQTVGMPKHDHPADVEALLLDPNSQIRASRDESACGEGAWAGGAEAVDVFLPRRDRSARRVDPDGYTTVEGLSVALCRLAPIACILSPGERSHHPDGHECHSMPWLDAVTDMPIPGWEEGCEQLSEVLDRHRITLVGPHLLSQSALPHLKIDTNLGDGPHYSIFDVWFHWMD